ncbi:helix-turn-helix domain-containing protein [Paenibacillus sp. TAB 01]|uniref:helix-turn-helix domain-containing protein n=1 Tax=Paenibacillus sp. TAB 01 TaxID=3368988 RepID=UPI003751D48D
MLQAIEQESLQLAVDPSLTNFFLEPDQGNSWLWHRDFLDKIMLVKNSDSFINEISFYNTVENVVLSNRYGVIDKEDYPYREDIERILASGELSQWVYLPQAQKDGYVTFARLIPNLGGGQAQGVLSLEIESSAFSEFMDSDTYLLPEGQQLFIVHHKRVPGSEELGYDQAIALLEGLDSLDRIQEQGHNSGSFTASGIDGKPANFLYTQNIYGRIYVTIVPEQMLAKQVNWIRGVTLLFLIIFISFGVILTYFNSKRAYNPIGQLMNHSKALRIGQIQSNENEIDYIKECLDFLNKETEKLGGFMASIQPTLREKFLQQLISGEYLRKEPLLRDCEANGVSVQATSVVLIVDADNIAKENRFRPEEKGIIAFVISNVMQELLQNHPGMRGYAIPDRGRGVALLQFGADTEQEDMLLLTSAYAESVCDSLKEHLSMKASVGVGRFYFHIEDVPVSCKEAENALQYRIFNQTERVLFIEHLENEKKQAAFRYPREYETAIIHALEQGELDKAAEGLSAFAETIRASQSYRSIYQSYNLLLSALITSLEKQGASLLDILEHDWYGQLQTRQTSQEIIDWFAGSLFPFYVWLTDNYRTESGQSVIQQVCKHIRDNCGSDLSLVQCAEQVGLSPSYLSRLFKKEMGVNFLDFVVECKVEEAKRLLTETDHNVSEIAAAVGYSERNLNRIFQRFIKVSPSTFRTRQR